MKTLVACALFCLLLAPSCGGAPTAPSGLPNWLTDLIATFQSAPVGNPARSVYRYTYQGRTVYYVPAQCCDQYSTLYDAGGHVLCAPDGGINGQGDGKCADFAQQRSNGVLLWRDTR